MCRRETSSFTPALPQRLRLGNSSSPSMSAIRVLLRSRGRQHQRQPQRQQMRGNLTKSVSHQMVLSRVHRLPAQDLARCCQDGPLVSCRRLPRSCPCLCTLGAVPIACSMYWWIESSIPRQYQIHQYLCALRAMPIACGCQSSQSKHFNAHWGIDQRGCVIAISPAIAQRQRSIHLLACAAVSRMLRCPAGS